MVGKKAKNLEEIVRAVKAFKKRASIEKAYLFGSYATGKANAESDVDLILLSSKFKGKTFSERMRGLWLKWSLRVPTDFICYTPEEFNRQKKEVSIAREALLEGMEI